MTNPQTENGYTRIANELYDAIIGFSLTGYQHRVLHALLRKTYGFNKKTDVISLTQIAEVTKIAKSHVCRAMKELKDMNIITTDGNKIGINKHYSEWTALPPMVIKPLPRMVTTVTESVTTITTDGNKSLPPAAPQKTYKDTYTKDSNINITEFGNSDINHLQRFFLQTMQLPKEDCPMYKSRRFWNLLLREFKSITNVEELIRIASEDQFYRNNITSSIDLYYKRMKLMARKRGGTPRVAVMKGESYATLEADNRN